MGFRVEILGLVGVGGAIHLNGQAWLSVNDRIKVYACAFLRPSAELS